VVPAAAAFRLKYLPSTLAFVARRPCLRFDNLATDPSVVALHQIMLDELLDQMTQMPLAEDHEVVQTLASVSFSRTVPHADCSLDCVRESQLDFKSAVQAFVNNGSRSWISQHALRRNPSTGSSRFRNRSRANGSADASHECNVRALSWKRSS